MRLSTRLTRALIVGLVAGAWSASPANAQEEPGGPRIPEPGGPRIPAPPPSTPAPAPPPPSTPTKAPPETTPPQAESKAPTSAEATVEPTTDSKPFRIYAGLGSHFPVAQRGGLLPVDEIGGGVALELAGGWQATESILLGLRFDLLFASAQGAGWAKILRADVNGGLGLDVGPTLQLTFHPFEHATLRVGVDGYLSRASTSQATSDGVRIGTLRVAPGEQIGVGYGGWSAGGTLVLAYRGVTVDVRYIRTQWGSASIAGRELDANGLSSDRLKVAAGYTLHF